MMIMIMIMIIMIIIIIIIIILRCGLQLTVDSSVLARFQDR